MDPDVFLELANTVSKMKMFPYFEMAHAIISCIYIRDDLAAGSHQFSRKHPFSCWVSSMINIFAGGLLSNFLLGEPIIDVFKNHNQVMLASAVWYMIFYSPFDIIYKICKFAPIKIVISAMKEVIRCKKIHDGVVSASKIYPNSYLIMTIIGTVKGNGSGFMKIIERLMRGIWTPNAFELLTPTFPTKAAIGASIIFIVDKKTDWISVPHSIVYLGVVSFFLYFKISSLLINLHDPFIPFENLFCQLFMGGVWDAFAHIISKTKKKEENNPKVEIPRREDKTRKD
ncbi:trimeric intracellular cation channel type 1B.1-like isoform X2 [Brevipalpus obovatus]|uniref:trimeric intracellular cation channel type 1B.1-like isoform X2 n=1 Tax=Brevipalpus obovatus TaxID=246614 RepID=UPI003D9EB527